MGHAHTRYETSSQLYTASAADVDAPYVTSHYMPPPASHVEVLTDSALVRADARVEDGVHTGTDTYLSDTSQTDTVCYEDGNSSGVDPSFAVVGKGDDGSLEYEDEGAQIEDDAKEEDDISHALHAAAGNNIVLPFPWYIVQAEVTHPAFPPEALLARCGILLRDWPQLWHALTSHLPGHNLGSMAQELAVVVHPSGAKATVPLSAGSDGSHGAAALAKQAVAVLEDAGMSQTRAQMATGMLCRRLTYGNQTTVACVRAQLGALTGSATTTPLSVNCDAIVVRIALKPLAALRGDDKSGAAWFSSGHTNACVVRPRARVMVLVEPAGREYVPGLADTVAHALLGPASSAFVVFHNYHMRPVALPSATSLHICTMQSALAALVALANPGIVTPDTFWRVLYWVYEHHLELLRLLARFVHTTCRELEGRRGRGKGRERK